MYLVNKITQSYDKFCISLWQVNGAKLNSDCISITARWVSTSTYVEATEHTSASGSWSQHTGENLEMVLLWDLDMQTLWHPISQLWYELLWLSQMRLGTHKAEDSSSSRELGPVSI